MTNVALAHRLLNAAVRDGLLHRQPCERCGSTRNIQGHHEDYNQPLSVEWLCVPCHSRLHRSREAAAGIQRGSRWPRTYRVRFDGDRLARDLAARKWRHERLASEAGVCSKTVALFLHNKIQTPKTAKKIARALGRSPGYYLIRETQAVA